MLLTLWKKPMTQYTIEFVIFRSFYLVCMSKTIKFTILIAEMTMQYKLHHKLLPYVQVYCLQKPFLTKVKRGTREFIRFGQLDLPLPNFKYRVSGHCYVYASTLFSFSV